MFSNKKTGFTLIELLVVIAIIGVLSTMAIIALGNARAKSRDAKRVADIKQISTALELYYADNNSYPTIITPGNSISSPDGTKTYMANIPNNPTPMNDGNCGNNNYTYASTSDNTNYSLNFCLGSVVGSNSAGINSSSSSGINTAPGLVGWWKFDSVSVSQVYDSSPTKNHCTINGTVSYGDQANHKYISFSPLNYLTCQNGYINFQSDFTVSIWVSFNNDFADYRGYFSVGNARGDGSPFFLLSKIPPTALTIYNQGYNYLSASSTNAPTWYFITVSKLGTVMKRYLNGQSIADVSFVNVGNSNNIYIGNGWSQEADAKVSDVRVYNRSLSAAEVLALYNATK
ncbi:MAG: prepilin-type N-terminal cleavage/methylation domain-containing protein [Candidatus Falkowbacteria bacterium]|nr:prepilin-type N-terminal cleavage/methylation domain-containing protein [Candidatus Falkowbacteria bacterium]